MLSITPLDPYPIAAQTGEKPQSKVWEYADQWWSVLAQDDGTWVSRLNGTEWSPSLKLSDSTGIHADVKADGDLVHVLLFDGPQSQLASLEYDSITNTYVTWAAQTGPVDLGLPSGIETATLDVDSLGRMWIAYDQSSSIEVSYADQPYSSWSQPIQVASGISSDDISVITAMPNNSIGVMWSNQNTERFGFRIHLDGTNPNLWTVDEAPASQSAQNTGGGMADDHLNVAVASDGTLYAAIKTSYDSSSHTKLGLLVRRPSGTWDDIYDIDSSGTRPIVVLNESEDRLLVAYTSSDTGGDILYRESPSGNINFSSKKTLISGNHNNVTSTKAIFTEEVVFLASRSSTAVGAIFSFDEFLNQPPLVSAGSDQALTSGSTANLDGTVSDDGLPSGSVSTQWSLVSGPGAVSFGAASAVDTTAQFSGPGTYVLRLTANDGQLSAADDVVLIVPFASTGGSNPVTVAFQDGVSGYSGTRDTKIHSSQPTSNFGSDPTLEIDGRPDVAALLGWDLGSIPSGSVIQSASLELNITNTSSQVYEIYPLLRAWNEHSATWQQAAAGAAWLTGGAGGSGDYSSTVVGLLNAANGGIAQVDLNGSGVALVQSWIDNPAANQGLIIQDYLNATNGIDFSARETSNVAQRPKLVVSYLPPGGDPVNQPPQASAGSDLTIPTGGTANLNGTVSDDGLPAGSVTTQWSLVSGPGAVSFGAANAVDTTAQFSGPGTYVLRLTANDGQLSAADEMTVVVQQAPTNQPPLVSAGSDQALTSGTTANLDGTVSDDGLPAGSVTTQWSLVSGPGAVSFGAASAVDTTAQFSGPGTYVLRLTANDGQLSAADDVVLIVPFASTGGSNPVTVAFQDGVSGYSGTRDTKIHSSQPTSNFGSDPTLEIDGRPDVAALLGWDLGSIPSGSVIQSASLELNITNTSSQVYEIYPLLRAWNEHSATWQQAAAGAAWLTGGAGGSGDYSSTVVGLLNAANGGIAQVDLNGSGVALVQSWIDNPAANQGLIIQDYLNATNGIDFSARETSNVAQRPKLVVSYLPPGGDPVNQPPQASAGSDLTIPTGGTANLNGTVSDDGLPAGSVTTQWSLVSGPGAVSFGAANAVDTTAQFSGPGTYVLRLTANDGQLSAADEMTVVVQQAPTNQPPLVSAGSDQALTSGTTANLDGTVSDDGLPAGSVTTQWSLVSGPGAVSFGAASAVDTTAQFSGPGTYVLRLTANDGQLSAADEMIVVVQQAPVGEPGLVGHWSLDGISSGTVADSSVQGNQGALVGSPQTVAGQVSSAVQFNGSSDRILIGDDSSLNISNQITIAGWIRPEVNGTQYPFKKARHNQTDGYELSLSSSGKVFVRFNQNSSGNTYRVDSSSSYPTNGNTWMHVVATYDGATIRLYINGVLESSKAAQFNIATNSLDLSIGSQDDGVRAFQGAMDDVRIYDRALSAAEIQSLYAG